MFDMDKHEDQGKSSPVTGYTDTASPIFDIGLVRPQPSLPGLPPWGPREWAIAAFVLQGTEGWRDVHSIH
jgi:hypothetical protein